VRKRLMLGLLPLAILACRTETPENRIRLAFAACVQAVEASDASGAAERLSPGFTGPDGMDRAGAQVYLTALLRREKVGVTVVAQQVAVRDNQAMQNVQLLLTGRTGSELLPAEGSRRSLVIRWQYRDRQWKIAEVQEALQ
jgi:hypothetical protein